MCQWIGMIVVTILSTVAEATGPGLLYLGDSQSVRPMGRTFMEGMQGAYSQVHSFAMVSATTSTYLNPSKGPFPPSGTYTERKYDVSKRPPFIEESVPYFPILEEDAKKPPPRRQDKTKPPTLQTAAQYVAREKPRTVVVALGENFLKTPKGGLTKMYESMRDGLLSGPAPQPSCVWITPPLTDKSKDDSKNKYKKDNADVHRFTNDLIDIAKNKGGCRIIDSRKFGNLPTDDGLHLTNAASAGYGKALAAELLRMNAGGPQIRDTSDAAPPNTAASPAQAPPTQTPPPNPAPSQPTLKRLKDVIEGVQRRQ